MIFGILKCDKCGNNLSADFDLTVDSYQENEYKNEAQLVHVGTDPPVIPDYLIFKCENRDCGCNQQYTYKQVFEKVVEFWAKLAWTRSQSDLKQAYTFDKFTTRYIVEGVTRKVLNRKDIEGNLVFKDMIDLIEKDGK